MCLDRTFWICFWDIWLFIDVGCFFFAFFSSYQPLELFLFSKKIVYVIYDEVFVNLLKECKLIKITQRKVITNILLGSCCYSVAKSCPTLCDPMTLAHQARMSSTISWSLLKLMSIESVTLSKHLILCHPLLLAGKHSFILWDLA